jgi:hypothetical protein
LAEAAKDGRTDDIIELVAEGANMEYKDNVRSWQFDVGFIALLACERLLCMLR